MLSAAADGYELLTALGEPTLASLGLCNYTPAGLVQSILENIHVFYDVPWCAAIAAGVCFSPKTCLFVT